MCHGNYMGTKLCKQFYQKETSYIHGFKHFQIFIVNLSDIKFNLNIQNPASGFQAKKFCKNKEKNKLLKTIYQKATDRNPQICSFGWKVSLIDQTDNLENFRKRELFFAT